MIRPTWASVYSEKPAYTSAIRLNSLFSSELSESHGRTASSGLATSLGIGLHGVSCVPRGSTPRSIIRASTHVRYASYPSSNLPLYLSMYSLGAWCGAWLAPGQNHTNHGRDGLADCWSRSIWIACSAKSLER